MRYHSLSTPVLVAECPTCRQGDARIVGEWWPDPDFIRARDVMVGGDGLVTYRTEVAPQVVTYQLDCGHALDARRWLVVAVTGRCICNVAGERSSSESHQFGCGARPNGVYHRLVEVR